MRLRVREVRCYERNIRFRTPFRFGVVTLREAPQLFVRVRVETEGGAGGWGCAAELLSAKWFDKNPALSNEENFEQLRDSLRLAARRYSSRREFRSPFELYADSYEAHVAECAERGLNGLIAAYGPALLDRAVLDGVCRLQAVSVFDAVRRNLPGLAPHPVIEDLARLEFDRFLEGLEPRGDIHARHTVGLVDPLTEGDLDPRDRIGDGLPETLEEAIASYGHSYFKIKLCGEAERDVGRLEQTARVLDRRPDPYFVTLDGNEQYASAAELEGLLQAISARPALGRLAASILLVEQPLPRDRALESNLASLQPPYPVIIDESDDSLDAFLRARQCGYLGISSKGCKGLYKSLINAARCALWNQDSPSRPYFLSAEDLTVLAGIGLQQDLAIAALLGLEHAERNGHHYVDGMAAAPRAEQAAFQAAHPDLYEERLGAVRSRIEGGRMRIGSLRVAGFGSAVEPRWEELTPAEGV